MKISAVYKITNTITGELYIGSSKDVKRRWLQHKYQSVWKLYPNNPLYQDMQKYGVENFRFQILCPVMPEYLKQVEQEFIETLKPKYNNNNAKGWDVERYKEYQKEYQQSEKGKEYQKKYQKSEKYKEAKRKYNSQLCEYNGEILTLGALKSRFQKRKIPHAMLEAKKYLITAQ